MTAQMERPADAPALPQWTLGDRMTKALKEADLGVAQMGNYLGVARNTVSTWLHDKIVPSQQTLMLWSIRTGVPQHWIEAGHLLGDEPATCPACRAACPHGDSNSEPTDYKSRIWIPEAA